MFHLILVFVRENKYKRKHHENRITVLRMYRSNTTVFIEISIYVNIGLHVSTPVQALKDTDPSNKYMDLYL
jgi:hypothetical protein